MDAFVNVLMKMGDARRLRSLSAAETTTVI